MPTSAIRELFALAAVLKATLPTGAGQRAIFRSTITFVKASETTHPRKSRAVTRPAPVPRLVKILNVSEALPSVQSAPGAAKNHW
jgi:hypothetical protein